MVTSIAPDFAPPDAPTGPVSAAAVARDNFARNLSALAETQPRLADTLRAVRTDVEWVFARDGSLTAFGADGKWWQGCSVPRAAAEAVLASLDVKGRVACLLAPTLASHLSVVLGRSRADQAVVSVVPDVSVLILMMQCGDFGDAIRSRRAWFACGERWASDLCDIFHERPGLATPTQFIRLPTTPGEEVERLIAAAQRTFATTNAARADALRRCRDGGRVPQALGNRRRVCVVAPSHFRLWGDAGTVLADALEASAGAGGIELVRFDPDDPGSSSALALADATAGCDAVVAADLARADVPPAVAAEVPWITWATSLSHLPSATPGDALLVAEPVWREAALAAGWRAQQVAVCGWPAGDDPAVPLPAAPALAVVADTERITPPPQLAEFSSHQLLWDRIASEIAVDPFCARDPAGFLRARMRQHAIGADGFDPDLFVRRLILPGYTQGIVRLLLNQRLPLRLFGTGWDEADACRTAWAGAVTTRAHLSRVTAECSAVVDVWPNGAGKPIWRLRRPVVRGADGMKARQFVEAARRALRGGWVERPRVEPVSVRSLLDLLDRVSGARRTGTR